MAELHHWARKTTLRPATIFIGGGTPTLLRPELWQRLLATLTDLGILESAREFTVEANPETVTPELLRLLHQGGVNRLSIGAQSFDPLLLKALERWHEPANVARAVAAARDAGFDNLSLDLIFAIPGQTMAMLDADLDQALALEPDHLSYYGLTYEPNTAMTQRLRMGQFQPAPEELERDMYARLLDRLDAAGFEQYEISNWARRAPRLAGDASGGKCPSRDNRCRHNLAYWKNANWLGMGPGAASHVEGRRWKNQPHLGGYLAATDQPPVVDDETLPAEQRIGELLMLGLRLRQGVTLDWLAQNLPADDPRHQTIYELIGLRMLQRTADSLRLTRAGLFVADAVIARLL